MPSPPHPSKSPRRPKLQQQQPATTPEIDTSLLDPAQVAILTALHPPTESTSTSNPTSSSLETYPPLPSTPFTFTTPTALQTHLSSLSRSLEPTIDLVADGVHKIEQYRLAAEHAADRVLGSAAKALEERDREAKRRAGTEGVGVHDVLRELGAVLGGR
jgi:kinetochore protein Mis13/DSN1